LALSNEEIARDLAVALIARLTFPDPNRAPELAVWLYRRTLRALGAPAEAESEQTTQRMWPR
jgi:hypothetical protein